MSQLRLDPQTAPRRELAARTSFPGTAHSPKRQTGLGPADYVFLNSSQAIGEDFRSARPCELVTPTPIALIDGIVHPWLRRRLGLQGRFYQLYSDEMVASFLNDLRSGQAGRPPVDVRTTLSVMMDDIASKIYPDFFPGKNLSTVLASILEDLGYAVQLKEGRGEYGSDLVVEISDELLVTPVVVGIQVGSYANEVGADTVREKLEQLLRGWDANHLEFGSLILTGKCGAEARQVVEDHNKRNPTHRVKLLDGPDLARFVLLRNPFVRR
jgi:Restriction endonuclease